MLSQGRQIHWYTISSPRGIGPGEVIINMMSFYCGSVDQYRNKGGKRGPGVRFSQHYFPVLPKQSLCPIGTDTLHVNAYIYQSLRSDLIVQL